MAQGASAASFLEEAIDTLPAGYVTSSENQSRSLGQYWNDTLEGSKAILKNGQDAWIFPTYTAHPRFHWKNEREQNAYPFGMGLGRTVIDANGNERTLFFVSFVDSNYHIEPVAGYQWIKRFPIGKSDFHLGAGYMAGLSMRDDYRWIPFPMVLPVASIGNDWLNVYGAWIPFIDVGFVYTVITLDNAKTRGTLSKSSAWYGKENFIYGGLGWEYIDNGSDEYTPHSATNHASYHVGLRHYSGSQWATDLSYRRSKHEFHSPKNIHQTYKMDNVSLQLQYNMDVSSKFRLYAGGGVGYSRMWGPNTKDSSIHPVASMGATYALTDRLWLNADMTVMVSRFKGVLEAADQGYVVRAMPTDFGLSLGYAF